MYSPAPTRCYYLYSEFSSRFSTFQDECPKLKIQFLHASSLQDTLDQVTSETEGETIGTFLVFDDGK